MKAHNDKKQRGRPLLVEAVLKNTQSPRISKFKLGNWDQTPKEREHGNWTLADLPFQEDFLPIEGKLLDRAMVKEQFEREIDARAVVWALAWGYPTGKIGGNRMTMKRAIQHAQAMADEVKKIQQLGPGRLNGRRIIERLNLAGAVNTSTTSKIAFFSGLVSKQGPCLIFDKQVIASIFEGRYFECQSLERHLLNKRSSWFRCIYEKINAGFERRTDCYSHYLRLASFVASQASVIPEEVEKFLFANTPVPKRISQMKRELKDIKTSAAPRSRVRSITSRRRKRAGRPKN